MNDELKSFLKKLINQAGEVYKVAPHEQDKIISNLANELRQLLDKAKTEEANLILNDINEYERNWTKANPTFTYMGTVPGYNFVGFLLNLIREPIDERIVQRENK